MFLRSCCGLLFFFRFYWFRCREIHGDDGMSGTSLLALATETAFLRINVTEVTLDGDSTEGALLLTLAATDTADLAGLHRYGTLVTIDAGHIDSSALRTLLTQFDDVARTSLHTSTAGNALLLVDLGNARLGIDADGIKLTSLHTVATA